MGIMNRKKDDSDECPYLIYDTKAKKEEDRVKVSPNFPLDKIRSLEKIRHKDSK